MLFRSIYWSVNKPKYASITQDGTFTAIRAGKVKVTAATSQAQATYTVRMPMKKMVAIDAGHQAKGNSKTEPIGPGATTKKAMVSSGTAGVSTKVPEYKLTLSVAKRLRRELIDRGYRVIMIRDSHNVDISNKERAEVASSTSDIYIRLHADGSTSSSVSGASALYPSKTNKYVGYLSEDSKRLSECVLNRMCKITKAKNRGLMVRDDLTGTNWSKIPVSLIEMGFMSNPSEDKKMQQKSYQNKIAVGIAEGIDEYFGY